jgi:uncharacterized protein (TIGR02594 family)
LLYFFGWQPLEVERQIMSLYTYTIRPIADWTIGLSLAGVVVWAGYGFAAGAATGVDVSGMVKGLVAGNLPAWVSGDFATEYSADKRAQIMKTANSWVGKHEDKNTKQLADFIQRAGIDIDPTSEAWCAAFVGAVLHKHGVKGTGAVNARSYLSWGKGTTTPVQGDVVVLWRGSPSSWQGHVGFYAGTDANGNILILGGNQGDKVSIEAYNPKRLLAYRTATKLKLED